MESLYEFLKNNNSDNLSKLKKTDRFWIYAVSNVVIEGDISVSEDGINWQTSSKYKLKKGNNIYLYTRSIPAAVTYKGKFDIGGNLLGLTNKQYKNAVVKKEEFVDAFANSNVIYANDLDLGSKTLADNCYESMFEYCTTLALPPELPATGLAPNCYQSMFEGCTQLLTTPVFSNIRLADNCYNSMFKDCLSIVQAPELPAMKLAPYCYQSMFEGCYNLIVPPKILPAMKLETHCYISMFEDCINLQTAPALPATQLVDGCYANMFIRSGLQTAPTLPATQLVKNCYSFMFADCKRLNYININIEKWNAESPCCWVRNVKRKGVFVKPENTNIELGKNGIPEKWTINNK